MMRADSRAGASASPVSPGRAAGSAGPDPTPASVELAGSAPAALAGPAGQGPAPARATSLLPTLVRLGGLPSAAVPGPEKALVQALERLRRLDQEMEWAGERLLEPLYRLVPGLERDERRAVLHAKRRVFQGRVSGLTVHVRDRLPADVGAMLSAWDDLVSQRHAEYANMEAAVASDLERSRALLAAGLDDVEYLRAVAVAAPALVTALTRRGRRLDDPRVLRTLYTLATRAALKASPFSGLTTVCEAGRPARGRRRTMVALHLAHGILAATARDLDPAGFLRLEAAPVRDDVVPVGKVPGDGGVDRPDRADGVGDADGSSPGPDGTGSAVGGGAGAPGGAGAAADPTAPTAAPDAASTDDPVGPGAGPGDADSADPAGTADTAARSVGSPSAVALGLTVVAEHDYANGLVFRGEEVQPARWLVGAHDRLTGARPDAAPVTVREATRLVGGRDPHLRLRRLLASGAVRPHAPWPRGADPFPALAATLSDGQRRLWGEDLDRLERLGRAITVEDGPGRAELLMDVQRLAQRIFPDGELGARPSGLLYEDCESRGDWDDPMRLSPFRQEVESLAGLVDPWVTRSRIYDLMVRRYVARYGPGGVCEDPLAFLMSLAHAPDGDPEMLGAAARDLAAGPDPERAAMSGGASASPRHMGAYLQPVDADREALSAGRGLVVVNAFTNGNGALQARFHRLLGRGYRERLARGIRAAWGTERVLEIQVSTDCNTAQAASCGVLSPLGLPGEPAAPDATPLSALRLAHDPRTDTLFLTDAHGPVGLAYLGLIPQYRLGGYRSWLVLLSDPWARMSPLADHWTSRRLEMTGPMPDEAVHAPRATYGRLVTRRESWTFPAAQVTGLLDRDPAATLVRVTDLRERWGIPAEVYVHQHLGAQAEFGTTSDEHKPRYVDLRSPVSLLALRGWVDPDAEHLSLIEALPAREQMAGATPAGRATVLEYLINMQWPKRPENGGDDR